MSQPWSFIRGVRYYAKATVLSAIVILITLLLVPSVIPFPVFGHPFWTTRGGVVEWTTAVWWLFLWGFLVNFIGGIVQDRAPGSWWNWLIEDPPGTTILKGAGRSVIIGTLEELSFRWVIYLGAIPILVFMNWVFGSMLGTMLLVIVAALLFALLWDKMNTAFLAFLCIVFLGGVLYIVITGALDPLRWLYEYLLVPIADWTSFGLMGEYLDTSSETNPDAWTVGSAIIVTNVFFRDGHKYQGPIGWVQSWYGGLVLFWVMFTFGLIPAIFVHALFNTVVVCGKTTARLFR